MFGASLKFHCDIKLYGLSARRELPRIKYSVPAREVGGCASQGYPRSAAEGVASGNRPELDWTELDRIELN